MSLRKKSPSVGNGPAVSDGETAQTPLVEAVAVVVAVVLSAALTTVLGLVGLLPHRVSENAAPVIPSRLSASRRDTRLVLVRPAPAGSTGRLVDSLPDSFVIVASLLQVRPG
jgi:hypothetical protein